MCVNNRNMNTCNRFSTQQFNKRPVHTIQCAHTLVGIREKFICVHIFISLAHIYIYCFLCVIRSYSYTHRRLYMFYRRLLYFVSLRPFPSNKLTHRGLGLSTEVHSPRHKSMVTAPIFFIAFCFCFFV